ncbi:hypothetical protein BegalDRAFT_0785 [Beggiatoa alba B18LD]|uniref:Uncharacterized protein n=2 Tax=Beggiatoa alba TaxID=1022 RepID=I3CDK3_9GAMM|nr:hypothetical protein BegalDRAFT_0785 [Beggiatoa alba B18LD]
MDDLSINSLLILAGAGSVLLLLVWSGILLLVAYISGWSALARYYAAPMPLPMISQRWIYQSMALRWFFWGYNNCLTIGVADDGFLIKVVFPLKIGHKPLLIPWSAIQKIEVIKVFSTFPIMKLTLHQLPSIPLFLSKTLLENLQQRSSITLPIVTVEDKAVSYSSNT